MTYTVQSMVQCRESIRKVYFQYIESIAASTPEHVRRLGTRRERGSRDLYVAVMIIFVLHHLSLTVACYHAASCSIAR